MRISASLIRMFQTCPRQYRYHYVDGFPGANSHQMAFGKAVHGALHQMYEHSVEAQCELNPTVGLAAYDTLWKRYMAENPPVFREGDPTPADYRGTATDMLFTYARLHHRLPLPLAMEYRFEIAWSDHTIVGFIDRIDEGERGLVISDFKTGRRKPSPRDLQEDLQLTIYAHAAGQVFGLPVEDVIYYHMRDQTALVSQRDESDFRRLDVEVLSPVVAAIQDKRFGPRFGWHCRFCDYAAMCREEGPEEMTLPPAPLSVLVP